MGKNQDPDPGSESGINIPDHISEGLEQIFWVELQCKQRVLVEALQNDSPTLCKQKGSC
jgi:hypothetical protein